MAQVISAFRTLQRSRTHPPNWSAMLTIMSGAPQNRSTPLLAPWPADITFVTRVIALLEALLRFLWLDLNGLFGFRRIHTLVARCSLVSSRRSHDALTLVRLAVRDACILYPKQVHCLQRSAAVTCMLRRRGLPARLLIGYQPVPVEGHAWVELNGQIVWDNSPKLPYFRILDRL